MPEDDFSEKPVSAILKITAALGVMSAILGLLMAGAFGVVDGLEGRRNCSYSSVIRVVGFTYTPGCYLGRLLSTPIGQKDAE